MRGVGGEAGEAGGEGREKLGSGEYRGMRGNASDFIDNAILTFSTCGGWVVGGIGTMARLALHPSFRDWQKKKER